MHTLFLKLAIPNSSYRISKLPAKINFLAVNAENLSWMLRLLVLSTEPAS